MKQRNSNQRIVVVDPNFSGGHPEYCHALAALLSRADLQVTYINCESEARPCEHYDHLVAVRKFRGKIGRLMQYASLARLSLTHARGGAVLLFESINIPVALVILTGRLLNCKRNAWFWTLHNLSPHRHAWSERLAHNLALWIGRSPSIDAIFHHVALPGTKEFPDLPQLHIPPKKFHWIEHHLFGAPVKRQSADEIGFRNINILAFGAVRANKGLVEFLESVLSSKIAIPKVRLTIAGIIDRKIRERLLKLISDLDGILEVCLEEGFQSSEMKHMHYSRADYALLAHREDFFAQSGLLLDAYQYSLPVIVGPNERLRRIVTQHGTGVIYDSENVAPSLKAIINNNVHYGSLVLNIANYVSFRLSPLAIAHTYKNVIFSD